MEIEIRRSEAGEVLEERSHARKLEPLRERARAAADEMRILAEGAVADAIRGPRCGQVHDGREIGVESERRQSVSKGARVVTDSIKLPGSELRPRGKRGKKRAQAADPPAFLVDRNEGCGLAEPQNVVVEGAHLLGLQDVSREVDDAPRLDFLQ